MNAISPYYKVRQCCHVAVPIPVGNGTVYATALTDSHSGTNSTELGIFFDPQWKSASHIPEISIIVDWPDLGVLPLYEYRTLAYTGKMMLERFKRMSIGCIGAHGRTGTYLAGLLIVCENLSAKEAIVETRRRLCSRCIESQKQINLIHSLAKHK